MSGANTTTTAANAAGTCRANIATPQCESAAKTFATLRARAALVGVSLVKSTDDRDRPVFIASRWTMTRQLDTIEDVERFLKLVGGPNA